jgi:hypothetical protein
MRHELEDGLARDMRVIPVLVLAAEMPRPEELPPELASLTRVTPSRSCAQATSGSGSTSRIYSHSSTRAIGADPTRTAPPPPPSAETEKPTPTSTPKPEADDTALARRAPEVDPGRVPTH